MQLRLGAMAMVAVVAACQPVQQPPAWSSSPSFRPVASPPIDVAAVIDRARLAFAQDGDGWLGGQATFVARATRSGWSLTPWNPAGQAEEGDAVRFAPAVVRRGRSLLSRGSGELTSDASGQLLRRSGDVVERLANTAAGLEHSWAFEARPAGRGALEVRVPVTSGRLVARTETGLHLTAGRLGVRYGHGTWVDARGKRTAVPATWESQSLVLRVPSRVLEASTYPAVLDPVVSPEVAVDDLAVNPRHLGQVTPMVAPLGSNFVVVWSEPSEGREELRAIMVFQDAATSFNRLSFLSRLDFSLKRNPAVACSASRCLIVWENHRGGHSDIEGSLLHVDLGHERSVPTVAGGGGDQLHPALAWDGTSFLVVWEDRSSPGDSNIHAARVDGAGILLDAAPQAVSLASGDQRSPAIVYGDAFLVAWEDDRGGPGQSDIYAARVDGTGSVLDPNGVAVSTAANAQQWPALSWDGTNYLVGWGDERSGVSADLFAARVSSLGSVLDPQGIAIATAAGNQSHAALAWTGTNHLAAWQDERSGSAAVYGALISPGGTPQPLNGAFLVGGTTGAWAPSLACSGGLPLLAWQTQPGATPLSSVRMTRLSEGASPGVVDPLGFSFDAGPTGTQREAAVASSGAEYMVVWTESGPAGGVRATRVSLDGQTIGFDGGGSVLARGVFHPSIAWGGGSYLVAALAPGSRIQATRLTPEGALLDPEGLTLSHPINDWRQQPTIAWDGTNFTVIWRSSGGADNYILAERVTPGGGILVGDGGAFVMPYQGNGGFGHHALAWGGGRYLVGHAHWNDDAPHGVSATLMGADGTVWDGGVFPIWPDKTAVSLAWAGTRFLVVASDVVANRVVGAFVSTSGVVDTDGGFAIDAGLLPSFPGVATDGTYALVVWEDHLSPTKRFGEPGPLYAAVVDVSGPAPVVHSQGVIGTAAILTNDIENHAVGVASAGPRRFLVTYNRLAPNLSWETSRVYATSVVLTSAPLPDDQLLATPVNTAVSVTLSATDPDGDPLTFAVERAPDFGALSGTPPNLTYSPAAGFVGFDSFTFVANDTFVDSDAGTIRIAVGDAGGHDGGELDAGAPDAGPPDGGELDAGAPDAGAPDAGELDAGVPDAGPPDAGNTDAGAPPQDAGTTDGGIGPTPPSGCGCASASAGSAWALLLLGVFGRRRRAPGAATSRCR